MDLSLRNEINFFAKNPDSLLRLSEFDIRNNILKLFKNLGWNVYNEGLSPLDYEVLQENTIKNGRPDLTFLLHGEKKFYVETKGAFVELNSKDVWQTWKYAWNSGLPFSVLSNFLHTWVIDCRATPPEGPPENWRDVVVKMWHITGYVACFDEMKELLGKDAVRNGSLVTLEGVLEGKVNMPAGIVSTLFPLKGVQPVDIYFLNQLDYWRLKISRNLFSRGVSNERIIELTDKILNFFVFVRFIEDRGLLCDISLKDILDRSLGKRGILSRELRFLKSRLNNIYNGTVFKEVEDEFAVDEEILIDIIYNLYAPRPPYQFDYIPVDMLGTIYERFLSRKIAVEGKKIKVHNEQESRKNKKEHGVFYTERFITTFMVNQVLKRILDPGKPEKIFKLRISDICCGSGSFLITAYKGLLFWFENVCRQHSHLREKYLERLEDGTWKLRICYKIDLLENCIYGVDIDPEAVNVTRFSLYLQLLEGESGEKIKEFLNKEKRPVLPVLDKNIKCGNSLVDYSIAEEDFYSEDIEKMIKPFNLKEFFKKVFYEGGFDVIVGNPPYNAKLHELVKKYCSRYLLSKGNFNSANLFIERVNALTKPEGAWILIVPKSLIYSEKWIKTRNYLRKRLFIGVDASKAFKDVKLEQVIVGCQNGSRSLITGTINRSGQKTFKGKRELSFTDILPVNITGEEIKIGEKIVKNSTSFGEFFYLMRGTVPLSFLRETGEIKIYQGKYIQGYHFLEPNKGISSEEAEKYSTFRTHKLMFQRVVSHTMSPFPHIRLVGAVDLTGKCLSVDTVSNIFIKRKILELEDEDALLLALGVLNSRVMSWFADRFVYAKAIRTMQFDNYQLNKLRFPLIVNKTAIARVIRLVKNMISTNIQDKGFKERATEIEKLINQRVAELFGLNNRDIEQINAVFGDEYLCNMGLLGKLSCG